MVAAGFFAAARVNKGAGFALKHGKMGIGQFNGKKMAR